MEVVAASSTHPNIFVCGGTVLGISRLPEDGTHAGTSSHLRSRAINPRIVARQPLEFGAVRQSALDAEARHEARSSTSLLTLCQALFLNNFRLSLVGVQYVRGSGPQDALDEYRQVLSASRYQACFLMRW